MFTIKEVKEYLPNNSAVVATDSGFRIISMSAIMVLQDGSAAINYAYSHRGT